jgi:DNA mismatch repair ATPase MutS
LRERYGDRVSLKFLLGQGFVVHFNDTARARKTGPQPEAELNPAYRGRTTRTFYHPDWTQIGSRLTRMEAELRRLETLELQRLRQDVLVEAAALRRNVRFIDELDTLLGFAHLAQELNLVRPVVDDSRDFDVHDGRHLGVELGLLEQQRLFTPNNVSLSPTSRLHVISGPNMGGKSTYLRHAALLAILAQCGSFVPARAARLGIVDRVFSRVGARDDVSRDRSTFMVEMAETSEILRRATPRSLVIADEIGRGTTTETGVALAFATLHHLYHTNACRTLFATHLHELADMLGWAQEERRARLFPHVDFYCSDMEELSVSALGDGRPEAKS